MRTPAEGLYDGGTCLCQLQLDSNAEDWVQYTGNESVYTYTFQSYKRDECPVCGGESLPVKVGRDWTLEKLVDWLEGRQELFVHSLQTMFPADDID